MKLTLFLLVGFNLALNAAGYGQKINLKVKNQSIENVFEAINKQTHYRFLYADNVIKKNATPVSLDVKNEDLDIVLKKLFKDQNLEYEIIAGTINVTAKKKNTSRKEPILIQQKMIKGIVTDEKDEPLVGVSVSIKGTAQGTSTDISGAYSLEVNPGDVLSFSYLGFISQEITYNGQASLSVKLVADVTAMEEVVVVGYGTQKRVSMTSAVSTVSTEQLTQRHAPNLAASLQGVAPGISVWDQGGEPGSSDNQFRIRGVATLGNTTPLVIIDGVEQSSYDINPNDIATVSVLKDAASTAIYGSRAANGVVLITTKKGVKGDIKINYEGWVDFQNLTITPKHMDTEAYLRLQNLAFENRGSAAKYTEEDIQKYLDGSDRLKFPLPNDWFNQVIRKNAPFQSQSLQVSGGGERLATVLSARFMDQAGVFPNRDMQRYQLRLNNDIKLRDNLTVNADVKVRRQDRSNTDSQNIYHRMIHGSQFAVPRYPDGTYGLSLQGHSPLAYVDPAIAGYNKYVNDNAVINLQANWEIIKGLKLFSQYALDADKNESLITKPTFEIRNYFNKDVILKNNTVNELKEVRGENLMKTWNTTLTYDFETDKHAVNSVIGYSEITNDKKDLSALGKKLYNNDLLALDLSDPESRAIESLYTDWALQSVFGRVNYVFNGRYIAEFSMRYDGSSRFPKGNRFTFFPTVSGAWRLSEESFWQPLKGVVNEFKLRGSWGRTGNQTIDLYTYYDNLSIINDYSFNDVPALGVIQQVLTSKNLTWETTTETDFGLDASLLNGKLGVTFDWYKRITEGILLKLPIPGAIGLNPAATNAGKVRNTGWEFQVNHRNSINDLKYDVFLNVSDVHNEVLDLAGSGPYFSQEKDRYIRQVGYSMDALWGYRTDGYLTQQDFDNNYPLLNVNSKVGDIKYLDLSDDGKITPDDKTVLGSPIPRWIVGAGFNLNWKQFDANIFFQGVGKQDMMVWGAYIENGSWEGFALDIGQDYWTPENPDAAFPRPEKSSNRNTEPSDWWTFNASYLRLKNLQVGYTLPKTLTGKIGIDNVRFYVGGTNLLTFSKLNDWYMDAETPSGRDDYYPPMKTYTLGLNVKF